MLVLSLFIVLARAADPVAEVSPFDKIVKDFRVRRLDNVADISLGDVCVPADDWYKKSCGIGPKPFYMGIVCMPKSLYVERLEYDEATCR